ncbi:hypothetical protein J5N97_003679 [Dioscorea zingiberensis]|uniref:Uncharacterized protein n=1 Tax=Dioscorea zingiberensis TaxID=325984 RepID=A0A9D5HQR4_9LILI|nr:hypothetical protein J5N97_003679 [Dioscorea zingiberensis]
MTNQKAPLTWSDHANNILVTQLVVLIAKFFSGFSKSHKNELPVLLLLGESFNLMLLGMAGREKCISWVFVWGEADWW